MLVGFGQDIGDVLGVAFGQHDLERCVDRED